ncbi:MAG: radical SAM family heme chaperone HemW, partial [Bdellovibrionales bacterium]|nr:radical SAM family heme chaperone HemW [Bdellovibrionales bacterium]
MKFGVYIHIPYCIQRCHYCDFTTFEQHSIMPPEEYLQLLLTEISLRSTKISPQKLTSIYFGGGTPSLFPVNYIQKIINKLDACGLSLTPSTEVTIEINPTTIDKSKVDQYLEMGINRFSVGAQSFSDRLLKICGREHNAKQTIDTLNLLAEKHTNFSLDLLYGLPEQNLAQLKLDVRTALQFHPQHVSAYCLTIPKAHPMNEGRPSEKSQLKMLDTITEELERYGLHQYEISNFSRPGYESQHNLLYWQDGAYWGLGLSAHSSFPFLYSGLRFWNPKDFSQYKNQVLSTSSNSLYPHESLPSSQFEKLQPWEALTDFCHISLRLNSGLAKDALRYRFGDSVFELVKEKFYPLQTQELVVENPHHWYLSEKGRKLSNKVFFTTTFLKEDFPH